MKNKLIACLAAAVALASAAMAGITYLDWPANGSYKVGVGPARVVAVDAYGSAVASGTIILKRIPADGSATNALAFGTLTCSSGALSKAITNEVWVFADDTIQRTGTATNARVRVVLQN